MASTTRAPREIVPPAQRPRLDRAIDVRMAQRAMRRLLAWLVFLTCWHTAALAAPAPAELLDQARVAREAGQFARSESLATRARDAIDPHTRADTLQLAEAWVALSSSLARRHMYGDTLGLFAGRRGLALYALAGQPGGLGAADAHEDVAEFLAVSRRSAEALDHQRAALAILRRVTGPDAERTAVCLERIGLLHGQLGRPDSAIAAFEEALPIYRQLPQKRNRKVGDVLIGIGLALEAKGEDDRAQASIDEGLRSLEAQLGPDDPVLASAIGRAAGFATRHGEVAQLVDLMERATRIQTAARNADDPERLVTRAQLGTAYSTVGDAARSARLLDEVVPPLSARLGPNNHAVLAFAYNRALAHRDLGDTLGALAMLGDIERLFERDSVRGDRAVYGSAVFGEGELRLAQGQQDRALELFQRARSVMGATADADPAAVLATLVDEMTIRADRGEWRVADSLDAALTPLLGETLTPEAEVSAWATRSRIALQRGRADSALAAALHAARIGRVALSRDARALSDAQALMLSGRQSHGLDPLLTLVAAGNAAARRPAWDELTRVRGLVRSQVTRRRPPPASAPAEWVARHAAWRSAMRRLARFEVTSAGLARDSALVAEQASRRADADEAERRLMRSAEGPALASDPENVTLDSVLRALPSGAALIAFATARSLRGGEHLIAFVAANREADIEAVDLGTLDATAGRVARWRAALAETRPGQRSEPQARAAGLAVRRAVWDPITRAAAKATALYLVPESPLNGLPWGALPEGRTGYLVETAPRITVLDAERDLLPGAAPQGRGALVVGGVDFDRAAGAPDTAQSPAAEAMLRSAPGDCAPALSRLGRLPGTATEAHVVAAALATVPGMAAGAVRVLEGSAASEASFKALAPGRLIVHVATHGVALTDTCGRSIAGLRGVGGIAPLIDATRVTPTGARRPLRPAAAATESQLLSPWASRQELLALAGANHARGQQVDENDGLLTAAEVGTLDLRGVDWVVLSACQSGAGAAWRREGVLGMQRAFHVAGARTVLASQWSVEDQSTREWMQALFGARARGVADAAEAMAIASREVLAARRKSGRSTHPFYWAAFTATQE